MAKCQNCGKETDQFASGYVAGQNICIACDNAYDEQVTDEYKKSQLFWAWIDTMPKEMEFLGNDQRIRDAWNDGVRSLRTPSPTSFPIWQRWETSENDRESGDGMRSGEIVAGWVYSTTKKHGAVPVEDWGKAVRSMGVRSALITFVLR